MIDVDPIKRELSAKLAMPRCGEPCPCCGAPCGREKDHGAGVTLNHIGVTIVSQYADNVHEVLCWFGWPTMFLTCRKRRLADGKPQTRRATDRWRQGAYA